MTFKDHFSGHAELYRDARPHYPDSLYQYLSTLTEKHDLAWDVGTGNGQAAVGLAKYFKKTWATDASSTQIAQAIKNPRVHYAVSPADKVDLPDASVDLVTVANAVHWFNFDNFYPEVQRVLRPNGVFAAWCYTDSGSGLDKSVLVELIRDVLGPYWPPEVQLVWNKYRDIPFPFDEIPSPTFPLEAELSYEKFRAYMTSWSSTQNFIKKNGFDPIGRFDDKIKKEWGPENKRKVVWNLVLKAGRKRNAKNYG